MSYKYALEMAGANVIDFEEFGSYQGDWIAVLENNTFVLGTYGSCSGCDSFLNEFGYEDHDCIEDEHYDSIYEKCFVDECDICQNVKQRLIEFAKEYLDTAMNYNEALEKVSKYIEWDLEAQEMIDFVKKYNKD